MEHLSEDGQGVSTQAVGLERFSSRALYLDFAVGKLRVRQQRRKDGLAVVFKQQQALARPARLEVFQAKPRAAPSAVPSEHRQHAFRRNAGGPWTERGWARSLCSSSCNLSSLPTLPLSVSSLPSPHTISLSLSLSGSLLPSYLVIHCRRRTVPTRPKNCRRFGSCSSGEMFSTCPFSKRKKKTAGSAPVSDPCLSHVCTALYASTLINPGVSVGALPPSSSFAMARFLRTGACARMSGNPLENHRGKARNAHRSLARRSVATASSSVRSPTHPSDHDEEEKRQRRGTAEGKRRGKGDVTHRHVTITSVQNFDDVRLNHVIPNWQRPGRETVCGARARARALGDGDGHSSLFPLVAHGRFIVGLLLRYTCGKNAG